MGLLPENQIPGPLEEEERYFDLPFRTGLLSCRVFNRRLAKNPTFGGGGKISTSSSCGSGQWKLSIRRIIERLSPLKNI